MDINKNETCRLLKLTTNTVEPLSFVVPRKGESFQTDLYPDTAAPVPAHSHESWFGGSNKGPMLMSMDPSSDQKPHAAPAAGAGGEVPAFKAPITVASLSKDLATANARIAMLEGKLKAANISF